MKKYIFFVFLLILFPVNVFAYNYNDFNNKNDVGGNLIYNIDDVKASSDDFKIIGWAFVQDVNTIGGKNYDISIIAIKNSDLEKFSNDPDSVDKIVKVESKKNGYSGGNSLFSSLCYKVDNKCTQVFYGYYKDSTKKSGATDSIKDGTSYASCSGGTTACIHYNPYFELSFTYNELKEKFGDEEVVFVVRLRYKKVNISVNDSSTCSYMDSIRDYNDKCSVSLGTGASELKRVLAFSDKVLDTEGVELGVKFSSNFETKFDVTTNYGRLHYYGNNKKFNYYERRYFNNSEVSGDNYRFNINNSKKIDSGDGGTGVSALIRWYELGISNYNYGVLSNGSSNIYYYYPGNNYYYYASSTWGTVNGIVKLKMFDVPEPPAESCSSSVVSNSCSESSLENTCIKNVSYIIDKNEEGTNFTALNADGCKNAGSIEIIKKFNFNEEGKLNIGDIFKTSKPNPGLALDNNIEFNFTRNVNSSQVDNTIYYKAKRWYKNSNGVCVSEEGYTTKEYLIDKLNAAGDYYAINIINNANKYILDEVDIKNKDYISKSVGLGYKYPDSNNSLNKYTELSTPVVYVSDDGVVNNNRTIYYKIKKAYIKLNGFDKGFVTYSNDSLSSDFYLDGGFKYYIPFNVNNDDVLNFYTYINDASGLINGQKLESSCNLTIENGNFENYRYRVIDLNNPFPNNVPTDTHAKNWLNLWNNRSSDLFLYNRRYDNNVESYKLDLNISEIRNYNELQVKYLNTSVGLDGKSSYIMSDGSKTKYFNKIDISNVFHKELGKSGVEK